MTLRRAQAWHPGTPGCKLGTRALPTGSPAVGWLGTPHSAGSGPRPAREPTRNACPETHFLLGSILAFRVPYEALRAATAQPNSEGACSSHGHALGPPRTLTRETPATPVVLIHCNHTSQGSSPTPHPTPHPNLSLPHTHANTPHLDPCPTPLPTTHTHNCNPHLIHPTPMPMPYTYTYNPHLHPTPQPVPTPHIHTQITFPPNHTSAYNPHS